MSSENDRHWGTICLGIVTIATAAIGVALFSSGLVDARVPEGTPMGSILLGAKFGSAGLAIGFYLTVMYSASKVIVPAPERLQRDGRTISQQALRVYAYLACQLLALLLMLIANFFLNLLSQPVMPPEPAALSFTP